MQVPLQITFHNLPHSEAIASRIEQQFDKLCHFCDRIVNCQVVVEIPHQHCHKGNSYHIRINLTLPGEKLVIDRNNSNSFNNNAYVVIRDAFNAAQRKLKQYRELQKI
ncbi:ribosome-associated translation inhibitor RaiA [Waterburya agarophytonicola K14]|uniref:Ribosome-associated translation inhibitor RaiA n=1 Tax=Waterburya agarophytonicola KI4 TaxID=2874699 RepID=A0A964BPY2_9CYAN|nr:HPF/RaiA family ribosome-associated protein [Waterburya agarophytonicola]MCC0176707.1 ribosome-associated translation inhibitor RaiA [Waterburya agarophytonicola KI4]